MRDIFIQHVEALVFAAPTPIIFSEIQEALAEALEVEITEHMVRKALDTIRDKYAEAKFSFELAEIAGGYQFLTKGAYHHTLAVHLKQTTRKRLSQTAMETLALIAYKQPVSKPDMEEIRGVSCDYALQKLLEKELVEIVGRGETIGKPLLYGTTEKFMDYLGINSLDELPKPKEFKVVENSIGDQPTAEVEFEEISEEEKRQMEEEAKAREEAEQAEALKKQTKEQEAEEAEPQTDDETRVSEDSI